FDAVESGPLGVLGTPAIVRNDARDLIEAECARDNIVAHRTHQAHVALRGEGAWRDGQRAAEIVGVRDTADVPKLQQDRATRGVYRVSDGFPSRDLLFRPYAGRIGIPYAHRRNGC